MSLKAGDVLEATFALSCTIEPVDPRTGSPIGQSFTVDLSNCKVVCIFFFSSIFFYYFVDTPNKILFSKKKKRTT